MVLNFVYTSEHQFSFPTDQPLSPHGAFLSFKLALEVDSGAQCAVGLPEELLICTNNPPYLLSFSWNGDVLKKGTALLADLDFFLDEKDCKYFHRDNVLTIYSGCSNCVFSRL